MDTISYYLDKADKTMDYFPFASAINNGAILIVKFVLSILYCFIPCLEEKVRSIALLNRLIYQKNACECLLLAFPFVNIFVALARDITPEGAARIVADLEAPPEPTAFDRRLAAQTAHYSDMAARVEAETRAERERQAQENAAELRRLDAAIAACPDTDAGRRSRELLVSERQGKERIYAAFASL